MKKKNYLSFLILFIFTLITTKTFAENKDIKDQFILDNELKLNIKKLITKKNTKEWMKDINSHINFYKRKIIIKKDYLKLIKKFPSNKNINSEEIIKDINKYTNIKNGHVDKINALINLNNFLKSEENFDIYVVVYNLKILNHEKFDHEIFKWFALCSRNPKHDKEMISIRKNLSKVFYFLGHEGYPSYQNSIREKNYLGLSESKLNKIVCNEFKKNK